MEEGDDVGAGWETRGEREKEARVERWANVDVGEGARGKEKNNEKGEKWTKKRSEEALKRGREIKKDRDRRGG